LSAMYLMSCLGIGYLLLHRRDFTEG
jgi:hypothetical protein